MATVTSKPAADAAIIIPHYNDVARLERCLGALMANDRTGAEIVVVDNGSTQSLDAVKRAFPEVRFLVETEKGAAAARNRGVAETEAPLLFFIDADCVAASDWTLTARRVAPLADLVGGRVDVFDETPPPRSGAEGFETVFAFNFRNYIEVQGFTGAGNLVTNRAVFDAVGGFRNGVSEDLEWSKRAVAMGYRLIYRDELVVSHPSRSDWATLRHKWHRMTRELYATNGSDPRGRLRWGLRALAMPVSALVHLPKVLMSPKLDGAGERVRAALTLIRLRLLRMGWMLRQVVGGSI
jgi:GT2 family glycosyltransferase